MVQVCLPYLVLPDNKHIPSQIIHLDALKWQYQPYIYTKQLFTYNTIVFVRVLTTVYDKLSISFRPHQDAKIFPQE